MCGGVCLCSCTCVCVCVQGFTKLTNLIAISIDCQSLLTLKQVVCTFILGCNVRVGYSVQGLVAKVKDTVANRCFGWCVGRFW